ncbi:MAG TPA: hypothetical protein DEV97_01920, partial [Lachnospiraceae bacterium]|nr:hypothetical protein [Lachnospiraceae bacterium]
MKNPELIDESPGKGSPDQTGITDDRSADSLKSNKADTVSSHRPDGLRSDKAGTVRSKGAGSSQASSAGSGSTALRRKGGRGSRKVLAALFLALLLFGAGVLIIRNTPTNRRMSDETYFGQMQQDEAAVILGDQLVNERAIVKDGALYLPYNIVRDTLNGRFYWDEGTTRMLFTTATQEFEIPVNASSYSVIDGVRTTDPVSEGTYDREIILRPDDNRITGSERVTQDAQESSGGNTTGLYVSADFLQKYTQVEYTWKKGNKDGGHVLIRYKWGEQLMTKSVKEAAVRYRGGIKSPILTTLAKGDRVFVLDQLSHWMKVLTKDGYIGYVKSGRMAEPATENVTTDIPAQEYPSIAMDGKVTLVWHQISSKDGNDTLSDMTAKMTGVNVISPTWFSLTDNEGNITSIGTKKYVKSAHSMGLQVWGLVSDFSSEMDTSAVLASTAARRNAIDALVDDALKLGLDGINLDFEYMDAADALAYVQFVRELSIECRLNKLVLSVDIKPPYDFNYWMNRKELATVADYLINMGYDEHYAGSDAGSVASLSYEQRAIEESLNQGVPAHKLISAIPFYTRIWYTSGGEDGSQTTTSEVLSMAGVQKTLESWSVTPSFDDATFQHYADWTTTDGVRCQIWIEDADSIAAKVRLVPQYDLAGTAAWVLG